MVLFNNAEMTYSSLRALRESSFSSYELILVDNASTDQTSELLERLQGVRVLRNTENLHFLKANNQVVPLIRGKYLLFLNNDAMLTSGALARAVRTLEEIPECGAVVARLVYPDLRLQEAGSIIWRDGTCAGYGRGDDPEKACYNFRREVDYGSGAFLLTRSPLFTEAGGFDERFSPAYYEEVDYCVGLQMKGFSVVYDPGVVVTHQEYGSSSPEESVPLMLRNRTVFEEKHREWLRMQMDEREQDLFRARFSQSARERPRVLYIDERIPHRDLGAGYPRGNEILNGLVRIGALVSVYSLLESVCIADYSAEYRDLHPSIELLTLPTQEAFAAFLQENIRAFDLIWVSRPNVFAAVADTFEGARGNTRVIYDAEAIFSSREERKRMIFGDPAGEQMSTDANRADEMALAARADVVVTVSAKDADAFREHGCRETRIVSHCQETRTGGPGFHERRDLLFVGNLDYDDTPNVDSVCWFARAVLPLLRRKIPDVVLHIAGTSASARVRALEGENIRLHGKLGSLEDLYDQCRIFVAPTRFSAGIPLKVIEAASQGLPVMATAPLCEQLGWNPGEDLWTAPAKAVTFARVLLSAYHDAHQWARVRENGLKRVREQYSAARFLETLRECVGSGKHQPGVKIPHGLFGGG